MRDSPASFLFPVRLHLGDSVSVLIVPCVRFITQHSGFFLSDSFILSHSLAKRRRPPLQCEGRRCWGTTPQFSPLGKNVSVSVRKTNVWSRWCGDTSAVEILWNWWYHYIIVFYKQLCKDDLADGSEWQQKTVLTLKTLFLFFNHL